MQPERGAWPNSERGDRSTLRAAHPAGPGGLRQLLQGLKFRPLIYYSETRERHRLMIAYHSYSRRIIFARWPPLLSLNSKRIDCKSKAFRKRLPKVVAPTALRQSLREHLKLAVLNQFWVATPADPNGDPTEPVRNPSRP